MGNSAVLPDDFGDYLTIANAQQRFTEASEVAQKVTAAGVQLYPNLDHAAIFCDPPYIVAGSVKTTRLYLRLGCPLLSLTGRRVRLHQRFGKIAGGQYRARQRLVRLCRSCPSC